MRIREICDLVEEAHTILDASSISTVMHLEKNAAKKLLQETYGNPQSETIDRYLEVVAKLKEVNR